jgi:hypothetical protein
MFKMLTYPPSLPADALDDLITNIEGFTVLTNRQQVLLDAWNVQGYLQGLIFGVPNPPAPTKNVAKHQDAVAGLKLLKAGTTTTSTIDWQAILNWIITVIQSLLNGVFPAGTIPTKAGA